MRWEPHSSDIHPRTHRTCRSCRPSAFTPQTEPTDCSPTCFFASVLLSALLPTHSFSQKLEGRPNFSLQPPLPGLSPNHTSTVSQILPCYPHTSIRRTAEARVMPASSCHPSHRVILQSSLSLDHLGSSPPSHSPLDVLWVPPFPGLAAAVKINFKLLSPA